MQEELQFDHSQGGAERLRWYVVRTKPRREHYAQEQLVRRGVETFFPRLVETARFRPEPLIGPLFPTYLFARVRLDVQYTSVIWTPGVRHLVAFGDVPTPLDDGVVEFIRERCGKEGIARMAPSFRDGDAVRVRRGPLEGLVGVVEGGMSGQSRVHVLMEILRRQTRVSVPVELLERTGTY